MSEAVPSQPQAYNETQQRHVLARVRVDRCRACSVRVCLNHLENKKERCTFSDMSPHAVSLRSYAVFHAPQIGRAEEGRARLPLSSETFLGGGGSPRPKRR